MYSYKNIIRDEGAVPAIVDRKTFDTVQEKLKYHRRMPSKSWNYEDYILTGKISCGSCGTQMVGESGRSHTGEKYSYYTCLGRKKYKSCEKSAIRADLIEDLVLKEVRSVLSDKDAIDEIANITYEYYLRERNENTDRKIIESKIESCDIGIKNIIIISIFD